MNTITFTVPWLPILAALGAVFAFLMARKSLRRIRTYSRIRAEQRDAAASERASIIQSLFPSPWDEAYERCSEIYGNPESRAFLRGWLSQQEQELPTLTTEAINAFARQLTFQYCDKWEECLAILAPYSESTRAETEATRARVDKLFSYPWGVAYKACCEHKAYAVSRHWLRKWIRQQDSLPALSAEAAEELLRQLSNTSRDEETQAYKEETYKEATAIIGPYLDVGYSDRHNIADYRLESDLPAEWFKFWEEIKDYPDRRSLFLAKMSRYALDDAHPVFKVPLTSKQAALMARALASSYPVGNSDTMAEFYASDLSKCVVMEGEKREADESFKNQSFLQQLAAVKREHKIQQMRKTPT